MPVSWHRKHSIYLLTGFHTIAGSKSHQDLSLNYCLWRGLQINKRYIYCDVNVSRLSFSMPFKNDFRCVWHSRLVSFPLERLMLSYLFSNDSLLKSKSIFVLPTYMLHVERFKIIIPKVHFSNFIVLISNNFFPLISKRVEVIHLPAFLLACPST